MGFIWNYTNRYDIEGNKKHKHLNKNECFIVVKCGTEAKLMVYKIV